MNTLKLAPMLTAGRIKARQGDGWLDVLAVITFAISAALALTVAGGAWMFYGWYTDPSPEIAQGFLEISGTAELSGDIASQADSVKLWALQYFILAGFACGLLVVPVFSLGSSAAQLGAAGRARRLASLRLVGMTGGQTTLMTVAETVVQWVIGATIGSAAYLATLPLWQHGSFVGQRIIWQHMLLPWWLFALILLALLLIAVLSTVSGLQKVRISPLGVARHQSSAALRWWRLLVLALAIIIFIAYMLKRGSYQEIGTWVIISLTLAGVIAGITVAAPFIIQVLAWPLTKVNSVPVLLAARRILDNPRAIWRTVSGIILLCFIAGYTSISSVAFTEDGVTRGDLWFLHDIRFGVLITLTVGFVVAAIGILINQASDIFDRGRQTQALRYLGFPTRIFSATRLVQSFGPLLVCAILFTTLGRWLASFMIPASKSDYIESDNLVVLLAVLGIGLAMCLVALLVVAPLEKRVVLRQGRQND
ncbi:hypothetical protein ACU19_05020 [Actinobaculum suis]|uniref:FtsX-like permease family protein n=1 Tax=Actinobaculum suis TaxID=1657 RepID=UPI00066FC02F|nr:FtsX-like permease family protein [Actinobaculum suis]KMY23334.1 hypothetical protein ACU19_05020 [Actinobaculum suis]